MTTKTRLATTVRFTDEDREMLAQLMTLTGLESTSAVIRMAIREALSTRQAAGVQKRKR